MLGRLIESHDSLPLDFGGRKSAYVDAYKGCRVLVSTNDQILSQDAVFQVSWNVWVFHGGCSGVRLPVTIHKSGQ